MDAGVWPWQQLGLAIGSGPMIGYLAAGDNNPASLSGFLISIVTAVVGFISIALTRNLAWRRPKYELRLIAETIEKREELAAREVQRERRYAADPPLPREETLRYSHDERYWLELAENSAIRDFPREGLGEDTYDRLRERALLEETISLFRRARMAFTSFLGISSGTSVVLLYGAYLALTGHVASGIVVALCGAIPGTFSLGLYRLQSSADKRAGEALKELRREVERGTLLRRSSSSVRNVSNNKSRGILEILATLRSLMPDASPEELASLLEAVRKSSDRSAIIPQGRGRSSRPEIE